MSRDHHAVQSSIYWTIEPANNAHSEYTSGDHRREIAVHHQLKGLSSCNLSVHQVLMAPNTNRRRQRRLFVSRCFQFDMSFISARRKQRLYIRNSKDIRSRSRNSNGNCRHSNTIRDLLVDWYKGRWLHRDIPSLEKHKLYPASLTMTHNTSMPLLSACPLFVSVHWQKGSVGLKWSCIKTE